MFCSFDDLFNAIFTLFFKNSFKKLATVDLNNEIVNGSSVQLHIIPNKPLVSGRRYVAKEFEVVRFI